MTAHTEPRGGFALTDIIKTFGAYRALDGVSVDAPASCVHALIGENGAGKTTLMRVLAGLERADRGMVEISGYRLSGSPTPHEAQKAGVGLVPQHCEIVPGLTVLENFALGWELSTRGVIRRGDITERAQELAARFDFQFRWNAPAETLGLGERQRLELLKVLWRDASVVVFDEPTTVLTAAEVTVLLDVMRRLASDGATVVFISHKLEEIRRIADGVTVLRKGAVVGRFKAGEIEERRMAEVMIGEVVAVPVREKAQHGGSPRLKLRGITTAADDGRDRPLRSIDLDVCGGEIVGIAGIDGNGQSELCEAIVGVRRAAGTITLDGDSLVGLSVSRRRSAGIGWIPPDRMHEGIDRVAPIWENVAALQVATSGGKLGLLRPQKMRERAAGILKSVGVEASADLPAGALSGGNIQRLIVGRELANPLKLLIASHPTRGVDVRGMAFIHRELLALRDHGCAVLVVSADLDELGMLADRVVVMAAGEIVGSYMPGEADAAEIGLMMSGTGRKVSLETA